MQCPSQPRTGIKRLKAEGLGLCRVDHLVMSIPILMQSCLSSFTIAMLTQR